MKRTAAKYAFPRHIGAAASIRLSHMDLNSTALGAVQRAAMYARRNAGQDPVMPSPAAGSYGNFEGIAELRRSLSSSENQAASQPGWSHLRTDQLRRTINVNHDIAIILASGDEYTGRDGPEDPHTIGTKGPNVLNHIIRNRVGLGMLPLSQGDLISGSVEPAGKASSAIMNLPELWVLLIATEERGGGMELSMPLGLECGSSAHSLQKGEKSKITHFGERIIITKSAHLTVPHGNKPVRPKPKASPKVQQSGTIDFDL